MSEREYTIWYEVDGLAIGTVMAESEEDARAAFRAGQFSFSHYAEEIAGDIQRVEVDGNE